MIFGCLSFLPTSLFFFRLLLAIGQVVVSQKKALTELEMTKNMHITLIIFPFSEGSLKCSVQIRNLDEIVADVLACTVHLHFFSIHILKFDAQISVIDFNNNKGYTNRSGVIYLRSY